MTPALLLPAAAAAAAAAVGFDYSDASADPAFSSSHYCDVRLFLQILPFIEFVGGVTPPYYRTRVTTGFNMFLNAASLAALGYILNPYSAGEAFKVRVFCVRACCYSAGEAFKVRACSMRASCVCGRVRIH